MIAILSDVRVARICLISGPLFLVDKPRIKSRSQNKLLFDVRAGNQSTEFLWSQLIPVEPKKHRIGLIPILELGHLGRRPGRELVEFWLFAFAWIDKINRNRIILKIKDGMAQLMH